MTEFLSVITSTGDADKQMGVYPVAPCDGYLDNVEIVNISNISGNESMVTMLSHAGNIDDFPVPATSELNYLPDDRLFSLHSGSYSAQLQSPDSLLTRKYFYKKRFYVKAGKPFTHYAYFHLASANQWSIIRARFVPQKGSIIQFRAKELDVEAQSDLNGLVDVAYNIPIGMKAGAIGAVHVTVSSTVDVSHGNIIVRHIRNNSWLPAQGDTTELDHTALRSTSGDFHSLDRQILAIRPFSAGIGEVKTGSFTFNIPTSLHEGDLITIFVDNETGTHDVNITLEISGRASGFSSYQYVKMEGTHINDLSGGVI